MKATRPITFHVPIRATNTWQKLTDRTGLFRKLTLSPVKTPGTVPVGDNAATVYVCYAGGGPKIATHLMEAGGAALSEVVPDTLAEMRLDDVWIYGTADDGVVAEVLTEHPTNDE